MSNTIEITNEEFVAKKKRGKVYTFWSPQVGSGCTFISYRFAKTLAEQGRRVCMLDFDLKTPTLTKNFNLKDTLHYIDNLLPYAEVGNPSKEVFDSYVQKIEDNLYFIAGNNNTDQAMDIQTKGLEFIVNKLTEEFEFVIIDTNSYIDNAGTFVGLYMADQVYTLIEKKIQSIHSYDYAKPIVENKSVMDASKFTLVINKVDKNILLSASEVEKYFGKTISYEITNLGVDYINDQNIGRGEEFLTVSKKAKPFKDSLNNLIKETVKIEIEDAPVSKKKGLFGRKGGK